MKKTLGYIGNVLLLGALLLAPIAITLWLISNVFAFLTDWFVHVSPETFHTGYRSYIARAGALVFVVLAVFLIGLFARNYVGRSLYEFWDRLLSRIPGVKLFYNFFRQIIEVFFASKDSSLKEVVLLEYPRAGTYMLGFVTSAVPEKYSGQIAGAQPGDEFVSVFIPMTPLPTSGWFAIVPRSQLTPLKMTPAEGMKLVVSGGAIYPGQKDAFATTSLLDKLETWVDNPGKKT
jgi:uncharacterized membrane protein